MYKVRIKLRNECTADYESPAFVDLTIPYIPRVGDVLYLKEETRDLLIKKASVNLQTATLFYDSFYYGSRGLSHDELKEENIKDLCFDDFIWVENCCYEEGDDFVSIILSKGNR